MAQGLTPITDNYYVLTVIQIMKEHDILLLIPNRDQHKDNDEDHQKTKEQCFKMQDCPIQRELKVLISDGLGSGSKHPSDL